MAIFEYNIFSPSQAFPSVIEPMTGAAFSKFQFILLILKFRVVSYNQADQLDRENL